MFTSLSLDDAEVSFNSASVSKVTVMLKMRQRGNSAAQNKNRGEMRNMSINPSYNGHHARTTQTNRFIQNGYDGDFEKTFHNLKCSL